jgi:hypothetical protein
MLLDFISQPFIKVPFAGLQYMQQCQVRVFHNFVPNFDPNEWCLKNGLHSGGLNPGPLGHESSALTTRPWLLAFFCIFITNGFQKIGLGVLL